MKYLQNIKNKKKTAWSVDILTVFLFPPPLSLQENCGTVPSNRP